MSLAETIANNLGGAKKTAGGFLCVCPCHDDNDKKPSLSIKDDKDTVIVNCLAGCDWKNVRAELESRKLLQKSPSKTPTKQKSQIIKVYTYTDENGAYLYEKVRFEDKKMMCRHKTEDGKYVWNIKGKPRVIYNLHNVLKAVRDGKTIHVVEGEKDADSLISRGMVATTSLVSGNWHKDFSKCLNNADVIIFPDNDLAGEKSAQLRFASIKKQAKSVCVVRVPEGAKDVTEYFESGKTAEDLKTIIDSTERVVKKAKPEKATREEYFDLFREILKGPRKDIFSNRLMTFEDNLWNPALNMLEVLKSEAAVRNELEEGRFNVSLVKPHLMALEHQTRPEFLIEIPEWDRKERVSEMAYSITLKECAGVSSCAFSELLKEWCAGVFKRMADCDHQNRILILQGGQGAGKDTWIKTLLGGLGQFMMNLDLVKDDKDTKIQLSKGLVMRISEFDKTAKGLEVSTLKALLTDPTSDLRAPYDLDAKQRKNRCSFISSANLEDLLRDWTGNRRFMIFEVEKIEWMAKNWSAEELLQWQLQILAQCKYLALNNYKASRESWKEMDLYIESKTPDDPFNDLYRELQLVINKDIELANREYLTLPEMWNVCKVVRENLRLNKLTVGKIMEKFRKKPYANYIRLDDGTREWRFSFPVLH